MLRTFIAFLILAAPAKAAVVVVINNTDREQSFVVQHTAKGEPRAVILASGEVRVVPVGKATELRTSLNGTEAKFHLDAYSAYVFVRDNAGKHSFQGIQLVAKLPPPDDIPETPVEAKPLVVPVRIFADDAEKLARPVWEKALRGRLEAAAEIVSEQCGVQFKFIDAGEWKSDPATKDFSNLLAEFETAVPAKANELCIGYTSRDLPKETELALTKAPFTSHILLREGQPRTKGEKIEVLAHQLGQYLGAVRSADEFSVMRVNLKDGRAAQARHRTFFDPLNVLAIHIWAEEVASGRKRNLEDLRPAARERLHALYKTQAVLHEQAKSEDTQAKEYAGIVEPNGERVPEKPMPKDPVVVDPPKKPDSPKPEPPGKYTPLQQAARTIVKAIVIRADDNFQLPAGSPKKLSGDALTCEYIRIAAEVAAGLDEKHMAAGFLIGVGLALDDSPLLRTNLLTRGVCAAVESPEETKARLKVLGSPTIRDRRDLCQHYVVSMALVALRGEEAANLAGITKELLDMKGTSGFSFVDLALDMAGVELAKWVTKYPRRVEFYSKGIQLDQHIPDLKGLREGLNEKQFTEDFRSTDDARFKAALDDIKVRIAKLQGYHEWK